MKRQKKEKLYEVGVRVTELWVMRVYAPNAKEADKRARNNTHGAHQIHSSSGAPYVRLVKAEGGE